MDSKQRYNRKRIFMQRCTYAKTKEVLLNEDALSYYLLGAFVTDGNVMQDKSRTNSFKCHICSKDKDWLELIQNFIGNEGKLRQDKPITKNSYSLWIYNKDIYDWLVSHECIPNKSISVKLPNIPDLYFKDFLRGCMDGDGCISKCKYKSSKNGRYYEQIATYLCGASFDLLKPISEKLNIMGFKHSFVNINPKNKKINNKIISINHTQYRILFSGYKRAAPFLKWVYDSSVSMPRKYNLAQSIIRSRYHKS